MTKWSVEVAEAAASMWALLRVAVRLLTACSCESTGAARAVFVATAREVLARIDGKG